MTDQITPDAHSSIVGGSTAARRLNCPRSYALEQIAPPDRGNVYAREGTALHEMIAQVLLDNVDPLSLLPFTFKGEDNGVAWSYVVDEDLWLDLGQPALDAFDDFIEEIEAETGGQFAFLVEARAEMPGISGAFGTSDIPWSCGYLSGIWDWKFGRTPVSADSDQLRFYARTLASAHPTMFGADSWGGIDQTREVVLSIMQPQVDDKPLHHRTTVMELEQFRLDLAAAVEEARQPNARIAKGGWCNFARCKTVCPLHIEGTLDFGAKMAALKALQEQGGYDELRETKDADGVPINFAEVLPDLLDLADSVRDWADEVYAQAQAHLEDGGDLEGWKLKAKRSSGRAWVVGDEEVKKFMRNRRYTLDDYMPRRLLTMPQVEKLLKRDGRAIPEEMYEAKPSSGYTLARADDPAPAIVRTPERMAALGEKLAGLVGETTKA